MPIEIKHRFSGAVLHTVDADTLREADLSGADLTVADLRGEDLRGANLSWANLSEAHLRGADLRGADLSEANLSRANLTWAGLRGANLSRANLTWAGLRGADLTVADLTGAMIGDDKIDCLLARATRSDGYEFFLFGLQDGPPKIKAGCRWMTISDYRAHVAEEYPDTDKARETLDILNFFEARSR